jgi:hypothetical protein
MPIRSWSSADEERGTWDTLVLGGKRIPGMARVKLKLPTGIKKRKATGKRGAGLNDVGSDPRELDIEIVINDTAEDRLLADDLRDFIIGKASGDPMDPLEILHESANYFGVTAVVLGDCDIEHPDPVEGWVWNLQAFEWLPDAALSKNVKDQKKKPKDDASAWIPFRDDGVAGSGAPPSGGSVHDNMPDPRG